MSRASTGWAGVACVHSSARRVSVLRVLALIATGAASAAAGTVTAAATPAPAAAVPALAMPAGDPARDKAVAALIERAFPDGAASLPPAGRELFAAVLQSGAFQHAAVGPFDVAVHQADGLKTTKDAKQALERAVAGLQPLAALVQQHFTRESGLVSARRFSVVITSTQRDDNEQAFAEVVALLDACEDGNFSGYKPDLPVWSSAALGRDAVRTWEVVVFNIAHADIRQQDKAWFDHGLGYGVTLMLGSRMLYRGAFGPAPPWLLQGLVDELDIEAYGEAWVAAGGSSAWSTSTGGWRNDGWEGFLPQGQAPPPPVLGPPANLSRSFSTRVSSDSWLERSGSRTRHWAELVADRKSEAPVSLAGSAAGLSFTPRDRAWARFVLHLLLESAALPGLLPSLDRESQLARSGLRDGESLPVIVAGVMGTQVLKALEARSMEDFLADIGRTGITARIRTLGADGMLRLSDHAAQADWLYSQTQFDDRTRLSLFKLLVEVENLRELREWELLGDLLDKGARAALASSKSWPKDGRTREAVAAAFREAVSG